MPTNEVVANLTPDKLVPGTGPIRNGQNTPPPQSLVHKQQNLSAVARKQMVSEPAISNAPTRTVQNATTPTALKQNADKIPSIEFTAPAPVHLARWRRRYKLRLNRTRRHVRMSHIPAYRRRAKKQMTEKILSANDEKLSNLVQY